MTETRDPQGTLRAAILALVPLVVAAVATYAAARIDGTTFEDVVLLPPEPISLARASLTFIVLTFGFFGIFVAPGLLVMRTLGLKVATSTGNAVAALVLSLVSVSIAWIGAQAGTEGMAGRTCLYLTIAVLDVAALVAGVALAPGAPAFPSLPRSQRDAGYRELLPIAGAVILCAAAVWAMPDKITLESLDADATDVHGLATSLFASAFPEWDLDSGAWGFYPTFLLVGYPAFYSIALLGDCEAALRLTSLFFLAGIVVIGADLAGRGKTRSAGGALNVLVPLLAAGYLSIQVGAYYAGHHPFHADLGGVALEEWLVTALAMSGMLLLRDGAPGLAAVAALLSILSYPSGLPLAGLVALGGLATHAPENRRAIVRACFALAALLVVYAVLLVVYTVTTGIFEEMVREWWQKYFAGRASFGAETPARMLAAVGWWALLAGGLPVLGILAGLASSDRIVRWVSLVVVPWIAFFALSPTKNIHYFLPVAILPIVAALRVFVGRPSRLANLAVPALLTLSVAGSIALCRPRPSPPYVADREFGRRTLFLAGSEREAVGFSRVLHGRMGEQDEWIPGRPWTLAPRTWVHYAERGYEPGPQHDFFVGQGPPPAPALTEIARVPGPDGRPVSWWSRDGETVVQGWKQTTHPRRTDASRFHFEMPRNDGRPLSNQDQLPVPDVVLDLESIEVHAGSQRAAASVATVP